MELCVNNDLYVDSIYVHICIPEKQEERRGCGVGFFWLVLFDRLFLAFFLFV